MVRLLQNLDSEKTAQMRKREGRWLAFPNFRCRFGPLLNCDCDTRGVTGGSIAACHFYVIAARRRSGTLAAGTAAASTASSRGRNQSDGDKAQSHGPAASPRRD